MGASVLCPTSHTLFDPEHLMAKCMMDAPKSYGQFLKLVAKCGKPPAPLDAPSSLPAVPEDVLSRRWSKQKTGKERQWLTLTFDLPGARTASDLNLDLEHRPNQPGEKDKHNNSRWQQT